MITIYNKLNEPKITVDVNEGSVRCYNLMKEDYIELKFTLTDNIPLLIGDYVDLTEYIANYEHDKFCDTNDMTTKLFVVDRNYFPSYNNDNGGWTYDVQIKAFYYIWDNKVFMYNAEHGNAESSFNLTDNITRHARQIVDNLAAINLTYNGAPFGIEIDAYLLKKGIKLITYSSVSILGALKLVADTYECEWWVDTSTIHLGYRKLANEEIPLRLHEEIKSCSTDKADGTHATRLYAFGGTTNIPQHYRDALDFEVTESGDNYVYDKNKPVKSTMFVDLNDAPIEEYAIPSKSTDSNMFETYTKEVKIELCKLNLKKQEYRCNIKNLLPTFKFKKIAIHGRYTDTFSVRIKWGVRLSNGKESIPLYASAKTISGTFYDMVHSRYTHEKDSGKGHFDGNGMYSKGTTGNEWIKLFRTGEVTVAECFVGDKYDKLSPFNITDKNSMEALNDYVMVSKLTPYHAHKDNTWYSMYVALNDMYTEWPTLATMSSKGKGDAGASSFYDNNPPKSYSLYDTGFTDHVIPFYTAQEGEYSLELYAIVDSTTNIVAYSDNTKPLLVFDIACSSIHVDVQKTAQSKDTTIHYEGEDGQWYDADVTVNPNFLDDTDSKSSILLVKDGTALPVGTRFRFPEIIRSEVIRQGHGDWFSVIDTDNVKNGVVQRNLMLPEGVPYVQAEGVSDEDAVESIAVYDWIYPKTEMVVEKVIKYQVKSEGEVYDRWAIRIKGQEFNEKVFEPNATIYIIFQNGNSAGLKYEAEWVSAETDVSTESGSVTLKTTDFKLKTNTDWGIEIPNASVLPAAGDKFIIEGLDLTYFDFNAISDAENELLSQARKDIKEMAKENVVVEVTLNSVYAYGSGRMEPGSLVNIKGVLNKEFPSRIIGYEEKLDIPYDSPKYIIGENNYYSKTGSIETKVAEVQKESIALGNKGAGGKGVTIITNSDKYTRPSDANVLSAVRVEERFMHTDGDDEVQGNIEFKKNISVNGTATVGQLNVEGDASVRGNSEITGDSVVHGQTEVQHSTVHKDQVIKGQLTIEGNSDETAVVIGDFIEQGDVIQGARINKKGVAAFASVKTPTLQVYELTYNRKTAVQGEFVFSDGDTVETVTYILEDGSTVDAKQVEYGRFTPTYTDGSWNFLYIRLGLKIPYEGYMTTFQEHDILYSNINNIGDSGAAARTGKCFMRVLKAGEIEGVQGVAEEGTVLNVMLYPSDPDVVPGGVNMPPSPYMTITRHGNETDPDRQDIFLISSEDGRLAQLTGVDSPIVKHDTSYGIVLGRLPQILIDYIKKAGYSYINPDQPYLYARGAVIQDLIRLDYKGKVIKAENYRGQWSQKIANGEVEEEDVYTNTDSIYDSVTHNGSLWQCNKTGTKEEPRGGINDWILKVAKGSDGDGANVYMLRANPTTVYVRKDGTPTVDYIDVAVGYTSPHGYTVINTDSVLAEHNLSVYYSTDKSTERIPVSIDAQSRIFVLEDGETVITTEDGTPLATEEGGIRINPDDDHVILYLVNTETEADMNVLFIPVVRDGKDGSDGKSVYDMYNNILRNTSFDKVGADGFPTSWIRIDNYRVSITVSSHGNDVTKHNAVLIDKPYRISTAQKSLWQNVSGEMEPDTWYVLSFYAKSQTDDDESIVVMDENANIEAPVFINGQSETYYHKGFIKLDVSPEWKKYYVTYRTGNISDEGVVYFGFDTSYSASFMLSDIKLEKTYDQNEPSRVAPTDWSENMEIMRGLAGPAGEAGAMILPYGNWAQDVFYKLSRKSNGDILGKPSVYHIEPNAKAGGYFVLEKDMDESSYTEINGVRYPKNPVTGDVITTSDSEYWSPMEKIQYIYTEALMANWAKFGSDKGAVFYDRFLFSQYGINKDGKFCSYADYQETMFEDDGSLSGEFMPALVVDMYEGYLKANKIAGTMAEYDYDYYANEIQFYQTYNVKYDSGKGMRLLTTAQANDIEYGDEVLVPAQSETEVDGICCIIINKANRVWTRKHDATIGDWPYYEQFNSVSDAVNSGALLLCAEPRLFNPYSWHTTQESDGKYNGASNSALSINDGAGTNYEGGRFVVNGYYTDFLLLAPGTRAILRSCRADTKDKSLYWYVENVEDFEDLPYKVLYEQHSAYATDKGEIVSLSTDYKPNIGFDNPGVAYNFYRRTFASKTIKDLHDKFHPDATYGSPEFKISVSTVDVSYVFTEDDWTWVDDVSSIYAEET